MNERAPNVTPLPRKSPDDSQTVSVPPVTWVEQLKRAGAIVGALATLLGAGFVSVDFIATKASAEAVIQAKEEVKADRKSERDEALQKHTDHPHPDSVPREVYQIHVDQAAETAAEAKTERREIRQVLDVIGKQQIGERRWKRELEAEGVAE